MPLLIRISQLTNPLWVQVDKTKIGCIPYVTFKMDWSLLHRHSFTLNERIILADPWVLDKTMRTRIDTVTSS